MHPLRKVNFGGTTPYWPRAAQLKAGGGCSMECKDSSYRQTRLDFEPVTIAFRAVSSRKICEAGVTSPGHRIDENPAGSQSPRREVSQRISKAGRVETFYRRRSCQDDTEYGDRPPARPFDQAFASPRRIEPRIYRVPLPQC